MKDFKHLHDNYSQDSTGENLDFFPEIFLVEDDRFLGSTLKKFLSKKCHLKIHYFESPSACLDEVGKRLTEESDFTLKPFCLVTDISFKESSTDGLLLIDLLKEKKLKFMSIAMTGFASIETAINATKKGVFHYLTKPFELEDLYELVLKSFERMGFKRSFIEQIDQKKNINTLIEKEFKLEVPSDQDIFCGMIGRSHGMNCVFERVQKVAASDSTVLINGPSGTGKELVANAIHKLSRRENEAMISVNCGAIPSELLESELFGHEKGAFTGAVSERKGRFELANKGSIFLDEIGDMPLLLQVKLLRVLQNRVIERVGSTRTTPVDVRIIAATHQNLDNAVNEGNFREDLFYRLNVIPIKIPALKERREDIPLLIAFFLSRFASADGRNRIDFDDEALEILMGYDWPGNVRELENLIERLVILKGGGEIKADDLPAKFRLGRPQGDNINKLIDLPDAGIDLKRTLSEIEDSLIKQALEQTSGNKNQASKLLSLNRTTLIEKMKKKGLIFLN